MMKLYKLLSLTVLCSCLFLGACGKKEKTETSSSSSKTSQTSQSTSQASSQKNNASASSQAGSSQPEASSSASTAPTESKGTETSQQAGSAQGKMNLTAIINGDFSSVAGTWRNDRGETLVFDSSGFVSNGTTSNYELRDIALYEGDKLSAGLVPTEATIGGAPIYMIPAGTIYYSEQSTEKDRIYVGSSLADNVAHPYYKVD
ncbi:DUF6287 domain-containing protein [Streptococcus oricebi]|uniref:DUF6287 domain-containing protein n=1 Tax=Streptococcus oricebi TaxID=1547447 RepID=A0ABS5B597_9STRE|nr:DUF6287 domain-containing protein [Streptococcus oricebi]MBP2623995.1 hypothetical protein [Streptococcus oricebi]